MKTNLTLTSGAATAAQRVIPISGMTPAQSLVRQRLAGLNQAYSALSMFQKGGWQSIANAFNTQQGRTGRHKLTPANAFVTMNSALLAISAPINRDAPSNISAPSMLPPIVIEASSAVSAELTSGPRTVSFHLRLASTAYAHAIQVYAAPPAPAGKTTFPDADFKAIGSIAGLTAGPFVDVALMYENAFGIPEAGAQVALKLIATSAAGIRLSPIVLAGIVTSV